MACRTRCRSTPPTVRRVPPHRDRARREQVVLVGAVTRAAVTDWRTLLTREFALRTSLKAQGASQRPPTRCCPVSISRRWFHHLPRRHHHPPQTPKWSFNNNNNIFQFPFASPQPQLTTYSSSRNRISSPKPRTSSWPREQHTTNSNGH